MVTLVVICRTPRTHLQEMGGSVRCVYGEDRLQWSVCVCGGSVQFSTTTISIKLIGNKKWVREINQNRIPLPQTLQNSIVQLPSPNRHEYAHQ
jgi:hypothetical protein